MFCFNPCNAERNVPSSPWRDDMIEERHEEMTRARPTRHARRHQRGIPGVQREWNDHAEPERTKPPLEDPSLR